MKKPNSYTNLTIISVNDKYATSTAIVNRPDKIATVGIASDKASIPKLVSKPSCKLVKFSTISNNSENKILKRKNIRYLTTICRFHSKPIYGSLAKFPAKNIGLYESRSFEDPILDYDKFYLKNYTDNKQLIENIVLKPTYFEQGKFLIQKYDKGGKPLYIDKHRTIIESRLKKQLNSNSIYVITINYIGMEAFDSQLKGRFLFDNSFDDIDISNRISIFMDSVIELGSVHGNWVHLFFQVYLLPISKQQIKSIRDEQFKRLLLLKQANDIVNKTRYLLGKIKSAEKKLDWLKNNSLNRAFFNKREYSTYRNTSTNNINMKIKLEHSQNQDISNKVFNVFVSILAVSFTIALIFFPQKFILSYLAKQLGFPCLSFINAILWIRPIDIARCNMLKKDDKFNLIRFLIALTIIIFMWVITGLGILPVIYGQLLSYFGVLLLPLDPLITFKNLNFNLESDNLKNRCIEDKIQILGLEIISVPANSDRMSRSQAGNYSKAVMGASASHTNLEKPKERLIPISLMMEDTASDLDEQERFSSGSEFAETGSDLDSSSEEELAKTTAMQLVGDKDSIDQLLFQNQFYWEEYFPDYSPEQYLGNSIWEFPENTNTNKNKGIAVPYSQLTEEQKKVKRTACLKAWHEWWGNASVEKKDAFRADNRKMRALRWANKSEQEKEASRAYQRAWNAERKKNMTAEQLNKLKTEKRIRDENKWQKMTQEQKERSYKNKRDNYVGEKRLNQLERKRQWREINAPRKRADFEPATVPENALPELSYWLLNTQTKEVLGFKTMGEVSKHLAITQQSVTRAIQKKSVVKEIYTIIRENNSKPPKAVYEPAVIPENALPKLSYWVLNTQTREVLGFKTTREVSEHIGITKQSVSQAIIKKSVVKNIYTVIKDDKNKH